MTADEILQQINEQLAEGPNTSDLYQLFSHYYPADARMTVFRSDKHWAIFFEFIGYDCRGQIVWNRLRGYGACLFQREMFGEDVSLILLDEDTREPLDGGSSMNEHPFTTLEEPSTLGICFPILARAIASGNLSEWNAQTPSKFNTDWRLYDEDEKVQYQEDQARQQQQKQVWTSLPPEAQEQWLREHERLHRSCGIANDPWSYFITIQEAPRVGDEDQ